MPLAFLCPRFVSTCRAHWFWPLPIRAEAAGVDGVQAPPPACRRGPAPWRPIDRAAPRLAPCGGVGVGPWCRSRWKRCGVPAVSTPVPAGSTASGCLGPAAASSIGRSCPGPAADWPGAARSPAGGGWGDGSWPIWRRGAAPPTRWSCSSLVPARHAPCSPCSRNAWHLPCRSGGTASSRLPWSPAMPSRRMPSRRMPSHRQPPSLSGTQPSSGRESKKNRPPGPV